MSRHQFLTCCALYAVVLQGPLIALGQAPVPPAPGGQAPAPVGQAPAPGAQAPDTQNQPPVVLTAEAASGKAIFEGKGACQSCHRVDTTGSRVGPDLSSIGSVLSVEALTKVLVDPNAALRPAVRSVRAVTKDGKVIIGRRLNEDMYTVQILDEAENLRSLDKSGLKEYAILTTARMPSYKGKLSTSEIAEVVEYLRALKNP